MKKIGLLILGFALVFSQFAKAEYFKPNISKGTYIGVSATRTGEFRVNVNSVSKDGKKLLVSVNAFDALRLNQVTVIYAGEYKKNILTYWGFATKNKGRKDEANVEVQFTFYKNSDRFDVTLNSSNPANPKYPVGYYGTEFKKADDCVSQIK